MKRILLTSSTLILLVIFGCDNSPKENEVYENKLTRERIKIEKIGQGKELCEFYELMNKTMKEVSSDVALRILMLRVPIISDDDTLQQCIAYEEKGSISARAGKTWSINGKESDNVPVTYMKIISIDKLKIDFVKVE